MPPGSARHTGALLRSRRFCPGEAARVGARIRALLQAELLSFPPSTAPSETERGEGTHTSGTSLHPSILRGTELHRGQLHSDPPDALGTVWAAGAVGSELPWCHLHGPLHKGGMHAPCRASCFALHGCTQRRAGSDRQRLIARGRAARCRAMGAGRPPPRVQSPRSWAGSRSHRTELEVKQSTRPAMHGDTPQHVRRSQPRSLTSVPAGMGHHRLTCAGASLHATPRPAARTPLPSPRPAPAPRRSAPPKAAAVRSPRQGALRSRTAQARCSGRSDSGRRFLPAGPGRAGPRPAPRSLLPLPPHRPAPLCPRTPGRGRSAPLSPRPAAAPPGCERPRPPLPRGWEPPGCRSPSSAPSVPPLPPPRPPPSTEAPGGAAWSTRRRAEPCLPAAPRGGEYRGRGGGEPRDTAVSRPEKAAGAPRGRAALPRGGGGALSSAGGVCLSRRW